MASKLLCISNFLLLSAPENISAILPPASPPIILPPIPPITVPIGPPIAVPKIAPYFPPASAPASPPPAPKPACKLVCPSDFLPTKSNPVPKTARGPILPNLPNLPTLDIGALRILGIFGILPRKSLLPNNPPPISPSVPTPFLPFLSLILFLYSAVSVRFLSSTRFFLIFSDFDRSLLSILLLLRNSLDKKIVAF